MAIASILVTIHKHLVTVCTVCTILCYHLLECINLLHGMMTQILVGGLWWITFNQHVASSCVVISVCKSLPAAILSISCIRPTSELVSGRLAMPVVLSLVISCWSIVCIVGCDAKFVDSHCLLGLGWWLWWSSWCLASSLAATTRSIWSDWTHACIISLRFMSLYESVDTGWIVEFLEHGLGHDWWCLVSGRLVLIVSC